MRKLRLESRRGTLKSLYNIRFPGQYLDAETGLHYNRFRYYSPELGRYISADPIGQAGGVNLYTYAGNSPTNFVDPSGLWVAYAGGSAAGGLGNGGGGTAALAVDGNGGGGGLGTVGGGGYVGAGGSVTATFGWSNAPNTSDLAGQGTQVGGSWNVGPVSVGFENTYGTNADGTPNQGGEFNIGLNLGGPLSGEGHVFLTGTGYIPYGPFFSGLLDSLFGNDDPCDE